MFNPLMHNDEKWSDYFETLCIKGLKSERLKLKSIGASSRLEGHNTFFGV